MPDLTDLLDRTTPTDLAPVDVTTLATLGRRRAQRRRAALAIPIVAVVVALGVVATKASDDEPGAVAGPTDFDPSQPVGGWRLAAASPIEFQEGHFGAPLSDGRVLVWGQWQDGDGAIYDPETDRWEQIPTAPLPALTSGDALQFDAQLGQDRLALVVATSDAVEAAVYDVAAGEWTVAPTQTTLRDHYDATVWDGTTLALVGVGTGMPGPVETPPLDPPATLRWQPGAAGWTTGEPAPLTPRLLPGVVSDGTRLAVWGGMADNEDLLADGAVYDLATDSWTAITEAPLSARIQPAMQWAADGRLVVGGGTSTFEDAGDSFKDAGWYDPASGSWEGVPIPAKGGVVASGDFIVAGSINGTGEEKEKLFLGPEGWETAPYRDLHRVGDVIIATSAAIGNPGDEPFAVMVRVGRDDWVPAGEASFTNRTEGAIVATGTKLVVVGGAEGYDLTPATETWVLDLEG